MRILLDEDVPYAVRGLLGAVLRGHDVDHVDDLRWKSKKDGFLVRDAASRGYDVFVTNDRSQLVDPEECRAIKDSGPHHVLYSQDVQGPDGLALAVAAILAGMPRLVRELEDAPPPNALLSSEASRTRSATTFEILLGTLRARTGLDLLSATESTASTRCVATPACSLRALLDERGGREHPGGH